jgi:subtilase family serine protease
MAAQGQTFFNASGDDDAFIGSVPFPSDSPNVVQVGGTSLFTLSAGGAWSGEVVWNWGGGSGSAGGISTFYSIPTWQQGISTTSNQGSSSFRNSPDVSLTADNVYTVSDNGQVSNSGGTSCSAPLWAGLTAVINQVAANNGSGPVGYINPAVYSLGLGSNYSFLFHDITSGNNISSRSGGRFSAVTGYDLCTGWGSPTAALVSALASPGTTITSYTISASAAPANGGMVTGTGSFLAGANVTLQATPNVGFSFTGWTENGNVVSTSPSYTFAANGNRSLVANFQMTSTVYTITLSVAPANTGSVSGAGTFLAGSHRIVNAAPQRKYIFTGWVENGTVVSTSTYFSFTLDRDRNLVAQFAPRRARRHR